MAKRKAPKSAADTNSGNAFSPALERIDWNTIEQYENSFYESDDWEQRYDELIERYQTDNGRFLDEFEADLKAAGLKPATINKHLSNVDFFINTYLLRDAPLNMRAGCYKVGDFLGDFFIRKCMWSTPTTISESCASFKKFYKSMLQRGYALQDDYDTLVATIKQGKEYWCDLCAEFNDPYTENPFSPFGPFASDDFPIGESPWLSGLGIGGEDAVGYDFGDIIQAAAEIALGRLHSEGMSEQEASEILEAAIGDLGKHIQLVSQGDDAILREMSNYGLKLTRDDWEELMRANTTEEEVLDAALEREGAHLPEGEYRLMHTAIDELWRRWLDDDLPESALYDDICNGYEEGTFSPDERFELWQNAWHTTKRIMRIRGIKTLNDYDLVVNTAAGEKTMAEWGMDYVLLGAKLGRTK